MKQYIKNNFEPLAIGFATAILYIATLNTVKDLILEIVMILNP